MRYKHISINNKCVFELICLFLAPDDYEPVNQTLLFDATNTRRVVRITIVNDQILENDEDFLSRLALEPVDGDQPNVQIDPAEATLVIQDEDGKRTMNSNEY